MKVVNVRLKFKKNISTLIWTADWHLGNQCVDFKALDCLQDRLLSNQHQWIHGADIIEGIIPTDKRFDIDEVKSSVLQQAADAVERLTALNKNCIGMLKGNHETSASRLIGCLTSDICRDSKIQSLTQTCFLNIDAPKGNSTAFLTHYMPSITNRNEDAIVREAAKSSRLRKLLRPFDADLKLGAHIHRFICTPPVSEDRLFLSGDKIKHRAVQVHNQWLAVCPAFLKVYEADNYAQTRLYEPTDIGWVEIDFDKQAKIVEIRNILGDGTTKRAYHPLLVD